MPVSSWPTTTYPKETVEGGVGIGVDVEVLARGQVALFVLVDGLSEDFECSMVEQLPGHGGIGTVLCPVVAGEADVADGKGAPEEDEDQEEFDHYWDLKGIIVEKEALTILPIMATIEPKKEFT